MAVDYSVETCQELARRFHQAQLHRPLRVDRYDPGTELTYEVTGVVPDRPATVSLVIDRFVGGGFAGQVYRVKITHVDAPDGPIAGLEVGRLLAMKILIPPSGFSTVFRNVVYAVGFQGPFQLQVNPAAAKAGALWQKFIRRAARIRFGDDSCVNDILATFVDHTLGSCGEFSEWVDGRTWRLEVDDHVDLLKQYRRGKPVNADTLGSPEYRAKHSFMTEFVELLHDMGAHEFARQYEWSTCKSQPNCLKRTEAGDDPETGLVAVDFRAGLALLPFLPMSPGDFKLILNGILRGSLVQFDRGNLTTLKRFIDAHPDDFADLTDAYDQLNQVEHTYRNSLPDITHNHIRLLYSRELWSTMFNSAVTGYRVRNLADENAATRLRSSRLSTLLFFVVGLLPLLGRLIRRVWARADYRRHYATLFTSASYLRRALRGRAAEKIIIWHRAGRVDANKAVRLAERPLLFLLHLPFSVLPIPSLHRILTDRQFAREKLAYIFVRPVRLYFDPELREQWLHDMVAQGQKNHLLTDDDAQIILDRIKEPFIQKYLKSLAVHVCTLPVTQIVSVIVALVYYFSHPEDANAWAVGLGILVGFQFTPVSPGSLCRGLYVLFLVIRERNFRDYNIAVFLGFFKYVGYLAFPIQMAYRYPVLARFMAAHWATGAVHIVPVFGEKGALLEHAVYSWFYNGPLTIRRRMGVRASNRAQLSPRSWHLVPVTLLGVGLLALADWLYQQQHGSLPGLLNVWWITGTVPMLIGALATVAAGGTALGRRIVYAAVSGVAVAVLYAILHSAVLAPALQESAADGFLISFAWRLFTSTIFATIGAIITELQLPEPANTITKQRS